ncbi:MAG: ATP-binding protein [Burkholderiales bacterium]|nr:ATP-binding protein [Burkholderiales bacterium]
MIASPLESITLADLQSLKNNAVPEGKTLEYKRDIPSDAPEDKKKMLRAICSLANTAGGDLIYGVEARDGIPVDLPGIDNSNEDALRLRLENSSRDGIQPRLPHFHLKFIPVSEGRAVLIVRVPKSWSAPHRLGQDGHFYGRNSAGSYQYDVGELRQSFTLTESIAERIRAFRASRLAQIGGDETPVKMDKGIAKLVFHVVPLSAFTGHDAIDIDTSQDILRRLPPLGASGYSFRLNLDGHVNYTGDGVNPARAYVQVFRSGIIEAVEGIAPWENELTIWPAHFEPSLVKALSLYLQFLYGMEVEPPFFIFLSLIGVSGYRFRLPQRYFLHNPVSDRDSIILPEAVVSNFETLSQETLIPLFKMLWNSFGLSREQNFLENLR